MLTHIESGLHLIAAGLFRRLSATIVAIAIIMGSPAILADATIDSDEEWDKSTAAETIRFVTLGYSDIVSGETGFRAMNFTTDCMETKYIIPAIRAIDSHNAFVGDKVADALARFAGRVSCVEFGRKGSPILWLHFPMWTHQREGESPVSRGTQISESDFEADFAEAKKVFVDELGAESFGEHETLDRKIWFWWD